MLKDSIWDAAPVYVSSEVTWGIMGLSKYGVISTFIGAINKHKHGYPNNNHDSRISMATPIITMILGPMIPSSRCHSRAEMGKEFAVAVLSGTDRRFRSVTEQGNAANTFEQRTQPEQDRRHTRSQISHKDEIVLTPVILGKIVEDRGIPAMPFHAGLSKVQKQVP